MAEVLAELGLGGASRREVGLVVGPPETVDRAERPHLEAVVVLAHDEVDEHELHHVEHGDGRTLPEPLEGGDLALEEARLRPAAALRELALGAGDATVDEAQDRRRRPLLGTVERRVRTRVHARLHAGEPELEDHVPVGRGMVVVAVRLAAARGDPAARVGQPGRRLGAVHLPLARRDDLRHRAVEAVPAGDGGEAVEAREAERGVVHEVVDEARLHHGPRLLLLPLGEDGVEPLLEVAVREARGGVGHVHAPLPLEIGGHVVDAGGTRRARDGRLETPAIVYDVGGERQDRGRGEQAGKVSHRRTGSFFSGMVSFIPSARYFERA